MNRRKERFIETFVTVMFPVALLVACTTNGNDTTVSKPAEPFELNQPAPLPGLVETSALPFGNPLAEQLPSNEDDLAWSFGQQDDDYVMVSPSLHLAIYKPSRLSQFTVTDNNADESVRMVKYNEPKELEQLEQYTFRFDTDDYDLDKENLARLKAHAEFLKGHPRFTLTISGHTDQSGSEVYNQKLSEQRAQLVAEVLVTYGVSESQLIVDGYGETQPVSDKPDENRRVELEYSQALLVSSM